MGEVKIREAAEGGVGALAALLTELDYPTSAEEMGRRLTGISADPSYVTLVAEKEGRVVEMAGVHLERTYDAPGLGVARQGFV